MRDIRYAVRTLSSTPAVTCTAILVLALGIGATTAIFTVADHVLFRPLPFANPERLVHMGTVPILEFQAYREQSRSFDSMMAYSVVSKTLQGGSEAERIAAVTAEPGLFDLLGAQALAGRTFTSTDAANTAVVSEAFRKRGSAGRAPALDNYRIVLDGEPYVVVGVMPAGFQFPYGSTNPDVWIPTELPRTGNPFQRIDAAVGRLSAGATIEAASAELQLIARRLVPPAQSNAHQIVAMTPLKEAVVGRSRRAVFIFIGAAAMLLLITCANVASLLLARAEARQGEVAVRMALGCSRTRVVRQCLTESLVLAAVAGGAALVVASAATRLLVALAGDQIPRIAEIGIDWRVFAFLLAIAVATGLAFGLVPALYSVRADVTSGLSAAPRNSRGPRSTLVSNGLVVAEIALAFVLLTGAGLLLRAFLKLEQAPAGIAADHVLTFRLETRGSLPSGNAPANSTPSVTAQGRYFAEIERVIGGLPGVRDVGVVTRLHIQSPGNTGQFTIPGRALPSSQAGFPVRLRDASPGYFRALGIPLRAGRMLTNEDDGLVVNEALVREHFAGQDPIGQRLSRGTIVGVVGDVRQQLRRPAEPEIFRPLAQTSYSAASVVVKTRVPPSTLVAAVRAAVLDLNPNQPLFDVRPMDDVVMSSHADVNVSLWLIGLFAALAVLLAMAGIYGVMSYSMARRRQEFGIRAALGADAARLLWLVSAQGGRLVAAGAVLGIAGALVLTRLLQGMLYEVTPTDPLTFIATSAVLVSVSMVACLNPARAAASVNPSLVLRGD